MYAKYFGLTEVPFKILPDPRYLWYSSQHKEAKAKIEYHLSQKDARFT
jgi:general secretion pathway protein A